MEDVLEACTGMARSKRSLAGAQDLRTQLHLTRRVDAVDVAEGRGHQVAAALAGPQHVGDAQEVVGRGVKLVAVRPWTSDTVLFAADDANLELEDDAQRAELVEQFG